MLQNLTHELSLLSKAVQHKNLSAAAVHVGLSQPQLSRIVSKLEQELGVILLDRTARRKSSWTQVAQDLAIVFNKGVHRLEGEILAIAQDREQSELHVGTLEGLSDIAIQFADDCFRKLKMKTISLDILDFKDLDGQFVSGGLDVIFTVRPPGRQKHSHLLEVGYQQSLKVESNLKTYVCSPFELTKDKTQTQNFEHVFVSNSLSLRQRWLKEYGGVGELPADTRKGRGKGVHTVYLIATELMAPRLWNQISDFF